jgi:hypothetical protein
VGHVPASSLAVAVTAAATANVKGAYTAIIASTTADMHGIWIQIPRCATGTDNLIDIAIGAAASEVIIAADLGVSSGTGAIGRGVGYFFPITIPAGTRIAARCQSTTLSSVVHVQITGFEGGFLTPCVLSRVTTYGAATADSGGVSIDPGATANTKGAYTQIVAATTFPIRSLIFYLGNQINVTRTSADWLMDIAVGGAGAEQIMIPDVHVWCVSTEDTMHPQISIPMPVCIPAGTRISARAQCTTSTATVRLYDLILHGVD